MPDSMSPGQTNSEPVAAIAFFMCFASSATPTPASASGGGRRFRLTSAESEPTLQDSNSKGGSMPKLPLRPDGRYC
jgi:hypothetical protein